MQLTAMILIVSSMDASLSLLLNISTADQQPGSRRYSQRSAKHQVASAEPTKPFALWVRTDDNASASDSPAASQSGGQCQFCAWPTSSRGAPQCSLQLLAASHLPQSTDCFEPPHNGS